MASKKRNQQKDIPQVVGRRLVELGTGLRVGVPRVGQGHDAGVVGGVLRLEEEFPTVVELVYVACRGCYADSQQQQKCNQSFHLFTCL